MPPPITDAFQRAREWGEAFSFPVVVYEWLPRVYSVVHLSLWMEMDASATAALSVRALVWPTTIIPVTLLAGADR